MKPMKKNILDCMRLWAAFCCIGILLLSGITGCQLSLKTPSKDFYSYNVIPEKWEPIVRDVVADPERQDKIMRRFEILAESLRKLEIESQQIQRDYLETLACYACDLDDFEPLLERIQKTEETSTRIILDMLNDLRENTTKAELEMLISRKLK